MLYLSVRGCVRKQQVPHLRDAFNFSPEAEFGIFGHRTGQLPPPAGRSVQHEGELVHDVLPQRNKAHLLLHLSLTK